MHFPKKFPTILGLLLFFLLVGGLIIFFERSSRTPGLASENIAPENIEITNVTDTSFTVSWLTQTETTGALIIKGPQMSQKTIFDDRDLNGKIQKYRTHTTTVRSLIPNTEYSFVILSNSKKFQNREKPFLAQTGQTISGSVPLEPAFGTIVTQEGNPATGALVYLTLTQSQKLSTMVTDSGSWLIPLNLIRTNDLDNFIPFEDRIAETILVQWNDSQAQAMTDTLNDNPVPEMTLGKTYDFGRQQAAVPLSVLGESDVKNFSVSLIKPKNGSSLPTDTPIFSGTGIPGEPVSLTIGITNPIAGSTLVHPDGSWQFTPSQPLAPGKQSVTATTFDDKKEPVAITHVFEILKSGTQVLGSATPSATLAPTFTPTPTSTLAGSPPPQSGNMVPLLLLLLVGGLLTLSPFISKLDLYAR